MRENPTLAYIIALACCILAGNIAIVYEPLLSNQLGGGEESYTTQPLLAPLVNPRRENPGTALLWGFLRTYYTRKWYNATHSETWGALKSLGIVFFLAAVAKATRPLFLTYIQHRVGVSGKVAGNLWFTRTVISLGIFAVLLPLVVVLLTKYAPAPPSTVNL